LQENFLEIPPLLVLAPDAGAGRTSALVYGFIPDRPPRRTIGLAAGVSGRDRFPQHAASGPMTFSSAPQLLEAELHFSPIIQLSHWLAEAKSVNIPLPHAMTLATASPEGAPSARIVLLKELDERGLTFVTNYDSRKGRELEENPLAALVFHWAAMGRQVRVEGFVEKVSAAESDALFAARPRENQLSSAASPQSEITTLEELDLRYDELLRRYEGVPVPRPPGWGGYRLLPGRMEFWQHRFARMNDRIEYARDAQGAWKKRRLAP
jgi:pyridoxamine 5'-phosphate oxidase